MMQKESSLKNDVDTDYIVEETSAELKPPSFKNKIRIRRSVRDVTSEVGENDRPRRSFNKTIKDDEISTSSTTNNGNPSRDNEDDGSTNSGDNADLNTTKTEYEIVFENARGWIKRCRLNCGKFVNNTYVEWTIILCIFVNAIMMGIATYGFVKDTDLKESFQVADYVFLAIFTIELLLQFVYLGFRLFSDGWLVFDFIVILLSLIGTVGNEDLEGLQVFRLFRVFRVFRLITRLKIMKDLVSAIFMVFPRISAIFLMLILVLYIFAVMFTTLFGNATNPDEPGNPPYEYFSTISNSLMTLFQLMTMDEWADIVRVLMANTYDEFPTWLAPTLVIVYVLIAGFVVVNLIIAVICDAIAALDEKEKAKFLGGRGNLTDDSESEMSAIELREQLDEVEDQIGDLTRIQARTFHTLQYLTQQLRSEKDELSTVATDNVASKLLLLGDKSKRQSEDTQDTSPAVMEKRNSGDRSRRSRRSLNDAGYTDKRKSYTDTWKEEGDDKALRKEMVTEFAKSARELMRMREEREKGESMENSARSCRDLLKRDSEGKEFLE